MEVHGGPAAAVESLWGGRGGLNANAFSALGYFVLLPNPRGSYGQGEAFTQANRKDFGYGDLRDILAGVDAVEAKYPVDPDRVGLTGWSYGGFMTMFAVTQTHRFRAAVAGAGISDWQSYYGENSIDQWMIPYFGASVYDDPAVYAKSSAINFIKQAKTPTLVVVGDRDGECPAPQSFEFWHALRDQHVPTQLVVYPNEGHGFVDPAHRRDVLERAVEWFARYMPDGGQQGPGTRNRARLALHRVWEESMKREFESPPARPPGHLALIHFSLEKQQHVDRPDCVPNRAGRLSAFAPGRPHRGVPAVSIQLQISDVLWMRPFRGWGKAGRGGFMRRFLTLICLLFLTIPAGITISGCYPQPGRQLLQWPGLRTEG